LREWLAHPDVPPDQLKSPFTLKVFFGNLIPKESLIGQVKEVRRRAQDHLAELLAIEQQIRDEDRFFYPYLTLKAGVAHARADLDWADDTIKELQRREDG
jgi:hypothetical protein